MRESNFHESANKILELEKEKKKLSLKVDQLQENCERFTQQNQELEEMFKNALEENKKLQDSIDNRQQANERQLQEREVDRMKLIDLEKHVEMLTKEKQRIQTLLESVQRRADDVERSLDSQTKEVEAMQPKVRACDRFETEVVDLKNRINLMERENGNLAKDVTKFKQNIEVTLHLILFTKIMQAILSKRTIHLIHRRRMSFWIRTPPKSPRTWAKCKACNGNWTPPQWKVRKSTKSRVKIMNLSASAKFTLKRFPHCKKT